MQLVSLVIVALAAISQAETINGQAGWKCGPCQNGQQLCTHAPEHRPGRPVAPQVQQAVQHACGTSSAAGPVPTTLVKMPHTRCGRVGGCGADHHQPVHIQTAPNPPATGIRTHIGIPTNVVARSPEPEVDDE